MISIESAAYVWDARRAVELIFEFVKGATFDDYLSNPMLRAAVEREFEIIGEALNRLRSRDQNTATLIPNLPQIIGLRNVLIHGYAQVDHRKIWNITQDDLNDLHATLAGLLEQAPELPP